MTGHPIDPAADGGFLHLLAAAALREPDRIYGVLDGVPMTMGELDRETSSLAAGLADRGVGGGSRVAVMMRNSRSAVVVIIALAKAGAIWVPVNVQLRGEGLRYILEHCGPALVIADHDAKPIIEESGAALGDAALVDANGPGGRGTVESLAGEGRSCPALTPGGRDTLAIMYTSGTTGPPKGVLVTHRMFRLCAEAVLILADPRDGDVMLVWEPVYHIGGAQVLVIPFLRPVRLAVLERFSASRFWDQARRFGATHMHYLGGILQLLLKQPPSELDRSHPVRVAWGGGCEAATWARVQERFGLRVRECYGMTEASSLTTVNLTGLAGSIGRPVPWFEVRVLSPEGDPVPVGERGEIVARPLIEGALTAGYFRNPEATASALRRGELHTGDAGSLDQDGNLYFHGRLTESIRRRGENVSAWEVEHVTGRHPDVEDSAVIGVAAEIGEQEIKIFVQPKPGAVLEPAILSAWLSDRLAPFQTPRYVAVVDGFERTPSQRIIKHRLSRSVTDCWDRDAHHPAPGRSNRRP